MKRKISAFALFLVLIASAVSCNNDAAKTTETKSTDSSTMTTPGDSSSMSPIDTTKSPNMNPEDTGRGVKPTGE